MPLSGKFLPYLLYPAAGLLAGWASVAVMPGKGGKDGEAAGGPAVSPRMREARAARPPMTPAELLEETRRLLAAADQGGGGGLGGAISGWTDEEVLAALDEAARDPDALLRYSSLATELLQAFAKRNPELAMRWAIGQPAIFRGRFTGIAIAGWLPERAEEAMAFVKEHPEVFGGKIPGPLVTASLAAATARGPGEFIARLREVMAAGGNRYMELPAGIAADFDYAGVLDSPDFAALEMDRMKDSVLRAWADRDREGAYRWLMERDGPGALMSLRKESWQTSYAQDKDLIRWMVGKVEELPPEQREEFLRQNADELRQQYGYAPLWIETARTPELRDAFRNAAAGAVFSTQANYVERGLQALATLPEAEARLRALEAMKSPTPGFHREPAPGAVSLLRAKLAEWGADPPRVEAILKHLHGEPAPAPAP